MLGELTYIRGLSSLTSIVYEQQCKQAKYVLFNSVENDCFARVACTYIATMYSCCTRDNCSTGKPDVIT